MPYKMRKLPNKRKWRVYNSKTGRIHAYSTSKENAEQQIRLLRSIAKETGADKYV